MAFLAVASNGLLSSRFALRRSGSRSQLMKEKGLHLRAASGIEQPPVDGKLMALSKFLVSFWKTMCSPNDGAMSKTMTLADYNMTRNDVKGFLNHFQTCRDYAADDAFVMATKDKNGNDALLLNKVNFPLAVEPEDGEEWGQFEQSEEYLGKMQESSWRSFPEELDDEIVLQDTKEWVRKVMADFGVCPFPSGGVRYTVSRATTAEEAFLVFWEDVEALLSVPEREISTVLTIYPELSMFGDYEFFEEFCNCLGDALSATTMGMEKELQLVFFHPKFVFRDGQARSGEDAGAANFARRGPWPMVNILRTPQVRVAQKGIPTGQVYIQNEDRLSQVGTGVLEKMLYDRDWEGLPSHAHKAKKTREKAERILAKIRKGEYVEGEEDNSFNDMADEGADQALAATGTSTGTGAQLQAQAPAVPVDEEEADALREAEIQRILALADLIEDGGEASEDAIASAAKAMTTSIGTSADTGGEPAKCPFDHGGAAPPSPASVPVPVTGTGTGTGTGTDSASELQRLVESEVSSHSVEDMLRLAEEVDKWMDQQQ